LTCKRSLVRVQCRPPNIHPATASKAALDSQAMRIGALIARWFYDDIEAGVRQSRRAAGGRPDGP